MCFVAFSPLMFWLFKTFIIHTLLNRKQINVSVSTRVKCFRVCCCGQDIVLGQDKDVGHFSCVQCITNAPQSFEDEWDESRGCCYCRAGLSILDFLYDQLGHILTSLLWKSPHTYDWRFHFHVWRSVEHTMKWKWMHLWVIFWNQTLEAG